MTKSFFNLGIIASLCALFAGNLSAQTPEQIIDKARAYLGSSSNLDKVQGIRYESNYKVYPVQNPENPEIPSVLEGSAIIIVDRTSTGAYRQRMEFNTDLAEEIVVLNGYSGWTFVRSKKDDQWNFATFGPESLLLRQATSAESLGFFKGYLSLHAKLEDLGTQTWEGKSARALRFKYSNQIYFDRLFDPSTGKLLVTRDPSGVEIIEEGENTVDGIRFPKKVVYRKDGRLLREETFNLIKINPVTEKAYFGYATGLLAKGELPKCLLTPTQSAK